jgi:hypothetical protein
MSEVQIDFGPCCFCGKTIEKQGKDPCQITVEPNDGDDKWQVWYCHGACFKSHLAVLPDVPGFFDPAHF